MDLYAPVWIHAVEFRTENKGKGYSCSAIKALAQRLYLHGDNFILNTVRIYAHRDNV